MGTAQHRKAQKNAEAAGSAAASTQAEVAGTFSSAALGAMGFGSSLAQKQLETLQKIEHNTQEMGGLVAD